ncbi:patatin-like phospholipase family protein [Azoarcus sp. KH32C]|uniref:patatin-like phospholipase family protein n=1 Tax=Azoarcus sp. KH32C TaxID=748247 RepID=UPI00155A1DC0|nr:patatin-like phospholipase family protein [Azoarcus sp. KH32C]
MPWSLNILLYLEIGQAQELVRAFYLDITQFDLILITVGGALSMMVVAWRLDPCVWMLSSFVGMSAIPTAPFLAHDLPSYGGFFGQYLDTLTLEIILLLALTMGAFVFRLRKSRETAFSVLTAFSVIFLILSALAPAGWLNRIPPWLIAAAFLMMWIVVLTGVQVAVGRANVLMAALALFLPIMGWLLVLMAAVRAASGKIFRGIVFATVMVAFASSYFSVTHSTPAPAITFERPSAETHFLRWIARRISSGTVENPYPVVLVIAEGGGVRAAYWTYNVLESLYDILPSFYSHLYAVSSISGASLGAASFISAVEGFQRTSTDPCDLLNNRDACLSNNQQGPLSMSTDLVGPATGGWLSQWLIDKLGLTNFSKPDRFEEAVLASTPAGTARWLTEDLAKFSTVDGPLLILGSTDAQSGRPLVASSARLSEESEKNGALDMLDSSERISLLNAAYHSARFPGISNPAEIPHDKSEASMAVDGGYYDNSAAETMDDYVKMIDRLVRTHKELRGKIKLILLVVSNKPNNDSAVLVNRKHNSGIFGALQSISTFEQVRHRRAEIAKRRLVTTVGTLGGECIKFDVGEAAYPIPVGWTLGRLGYLEMEKHLNELRVLKVNGAVRRVAEALDVKIPFPATEPPKRSFLCKQSAEI